MLCLSPQHNPYINSLKTINLTNDKVDEPPVKPLEVKMRRVHLINQHQSIYNTYTCGIYANQSDLKCSLIVHFVEKTLFSNKNITYKKRILHYLVGTVGSVYFLEGHTGAIAVRTSPHIKLTNK